MNISLKETCNFLKNANKVCLITHKSPDGDTLGSSFALKYALQKLKKTVFVVCNDEVPEKLKFLGELDTIDNIVENPTFVSIDLADTSLLGDLLCFTQNKISLCIDHHITNNNYAARSFVVAKAAATAEIIYEIICELNIEIDKKIADCIYTGISTDTGCFKYPNTTSNTHLIASKMINYGCDFKNINKKLFETKSKPQITLEKYVLSSLDFYYNGKCAVTQISAEMKKKVNISDYELNFISSIPKQIEGVIVGVTLKEKDNYEIKASVRTDGQVSAYEICSLLGGGGHTAAAGCTIKTGLKEARRKILDAIGKVLMETTK